mgnify:CR=1 FL=1
MKQGVRMVSLRARASWVVCIAGAALLAGCSSGPRRPAPVEDRTAAPDAARAPAQASKPATAPASAGAVSQSGNVQAAPATGSAAPAPITASGTVAPLPPGAENAGKPGYYTVKSGDTLIRIALDNGQNLRDIVRWNQLDNPNRIEVGQVLRVVPPVAAEVAVAPASTPVLGQGAATGATSTAPAASVPAPAANRPAAAADEDLGWIWPASGQLLAGFDEVRNKGLDLAGNAGDPVLAAAEGRVVYAGAGLRG